MFLPNLGNTGLHQCDLQQFQSCRHGIERSYNCLSLTSSPNCNYLLQKIFQSCTRKISHLSYENVQTEIHWND